MEGKIQKKGVDIDAKKRVFAYEVDGFGGYYSLLIFFSLFSHYLSDDANVPSLLSLPYLQVCSIDDPIYQATRRMLLSQDNPWFFQGLAETNAGNIINLGTSASGIGSPHGNGPNWIWPMSIIMRAL